MQLVDTSVWISFFNNAKSPAAAYIEAALLSNHPLCINAVIEMEILQGIKNEQSYALTRDYLEAFQYFPDLPRRYFQQATQIYRACRRRGQSIRRSLDCLIAANALIDDLIVVHQDRDFDAIKTVFPQLAVIRI
jgi:hypothetical protein